MEDFKVRFLNPKRLKFIQEGEGSITLEIEGKKRFERVILRRCFPLTNPNQYISVQDCEEREIGMIKDISKLSPESRRVVEAELERRYFIPVIKRILALKEKGGIVEWEVETNKGPRKFITYGIHNAVRALGLRRLIVTDVDGNRYEILDWAELDPKSMALIGKVI